MSEPKVEFELDKITDDELRRQFDQFREWYEFREDNNTPAMQTFEGDISANQRVEHSVDGEVYGVVGMAQRYSSSTEKFYWTPIDEVSGTGQLVYFSFNSSYEPNDTVRLWNRNTTKSLKYTLTVFYRG